MYRVTKRQPHKTVSQEHYANQILAMLRRDMINSTSDEFSGAIIEKINVADLITINPYNVELQGEGDAWKAEFEIVIDNDHNLAISFKAENTGNPRHQESKWRVFDFSFHDYETETDHNGIKMGSDTIEELKEMVDRKMEDEVTDYAHREYLES